LGGIVRVTILYQFFQSEEEPGHNLIEAFARYLKDRGDEVSIVSGEHGYMDPKPVAAPFWRRLMRQETVDGVPIIRTFSASYGHSGLDRRFFSMMSFSVSCLLGLLRGPRPDVIYASSPPLLPMLSAWLASRIRGVPLVLEVRDLWPASLTELAARRAKPLVGVMERLERFLYDKSALIITLTEGIRKNILERGWSPEKVHTIRYGVTADRFFPDREGAGRVRIAEQWDDLKIVLYLGAHGLANDLDVILRAADRLRRRADIRFVLIGNGIEKERLVADAKKMGLGNLAFRAPIPARDAPAYINAADLCVATLKNTSLFRSAIPSKLIEYMACGKAVIVGIRGEAEAIVEQAKAGLVFEPGDDAELAAGVESLIDDQPLRAEMGERGRREAAERFSLERSQTALRGLLRQATQRDARTQLP
jgi:glycosyltransferase involved in cell wall biosynthesis